MLVKSDSNPAPVAAAGFTLLELLVTLAILAILSAIALPSYQDQVTRGRIVDATSGLAARRVQSEQYFQDNRTYADVSSSIKNPGCAADSESSSYFNFKCGDGASATAYTIQAVGKSSMAGFTYQIDQANNKSTSAVPDSSWGTPPINCWVVRKGGAC